MRWITLTAIACAAVLVFPAAATAKTMRGKVVRVTDGDSVRVKTGKRTRTYGLLGVRAPARGDCFARESKRRLRKLLPRRARVRLVTEKGAGRRRAYVFRRRSFVNAAMLASGHARPDGTVELRRGARLERAAERGSARGLWRACEQQPETQTPLPPPSDEKQQDIAALDALLQGVRIYTVTTQNGTTDEQTADLCSDHRFVHVLQTSFDGTPIAPTETIGTWKVVDALVDEATGVRQAIVETLADGQTEPVRTFLHVNADLASGRWDEQAASFSRSPLCG